MQTEHVQRALIRTILAEFEHADEYGRHKLVVLIDKLASAGTFSTVAVSGGKAQFKRAARQVIQRVRVQRKLQAAREEAARAAAELAAGPPLGVSIKPNAIVGVTIMKGVFAPDADGRWGEILADPDYAGDTKLRYIDDGTESDYIKQHDLGKAVRSRDDLIENWPPEPEPVPAPGPEYMDMLKRESAKGESLQTVIEWLAGAPYDFVFAVKALDGLCAGPLHIKEEIGSSPSTAIMIQCSAKILSDAIQACKVEDHAEHHNIWDDKANHMRGDEEEVQRAEHAVFKTIWSAMRHRRKPFGHELADIKATFDAVNSDNSGWVSLQEFQVAMKRLDLGLSDEQLQVVFDASDKSHDGKLQYAEFAEELHLRHATPLQTYAHRVACLLRLLTTQGMGRLVQSAGIAAIVCLAEDPKTCSILVQLGAMDILVDMQKSGDVTPYWSDISCGNIASHARIALSSLLAHMRTPDTVFSITSGLLALVTSNKQLFTGKDKAAHRVFRAAGWTNALIAIDSLELLKAGNVGEKEAVDVLAGVNLPGERPHKKKGTRLPNERTDERTDQAGRAAGAIGLMLNVIKRLTGNDKHKRDFGPDPVPNKGATATQCVAAVLGILVALMGHGQEAATRDLIAYQGDVIFFNKLVEMIPALQEPCTPILIIVREYDILRKTAEKMRDRELAEAAIRIQTNFREWKAKRLEAEAKRKAELEAKRKRRKEAQQKIKGKGKGKGTGKGKGKGKPALRASGSVNASSACSATQ
jgi:hypothetical protein